MTTNTELGSVTPDRRRATDDCTGECSAIFILERRVNSHTNELRTLKELIATNNAQTKEILDIVGLGRAFFKVLGWIGSMLKPIMVIAAAIAATITWIKTGTLK
jgi:hypothetical protein